MRKAQRACKKVDFKMENNLSLTGKLRLVPLHDPERLKRSQELFKTDSQTPWFDFLRSLEPYIEPTEYRWEAWELRESQEELE